MEVLCTPRRVKRSSGLEDRRKASERRKSLFGVSGVSPLTSPELSCNEPSPSHSWSAESPLKPATPVRTPVKSLQNDFTQMALTRTPENRIGIVSMRRSPRILGVRRLSPDRGVITPKTFYGKSALSLSDGKLLYEKIRESVRVRLPMETIPKEKKRARSSDSASKRPKKIPRYKLFTEDAKSMKKKKKKEKGKPLSEKKLKERKLEKKDKPNYNWQFFNTKTPPTARLSHIFSEKSPSVLTPPPSIKKRKLISSYDMDHLQASELSPQKETALSYESELAQAIAADFSEDEEDTLEKEKDVEQLIQELHRDVADALGDQAVEEELKQSENGEKSSEHPSESKKLFPLFSMSRTSPTKCAPTHNRTGIKLKRPRTDKDQLILDVGQSNLKEVHCSGCGLLYVNGDDLDEAFHANHHSACKALTFPNWKNTRCVRIWNFDTIVQVKQGDAKAWWEKVRQVLEVVDKELGYPEEWDPPSQVYLHIKKNRIVGCLTAKPLKSAHRLLPDLGLTANFCSEETYPVKVGISRLWVHAEHRRDGIASVLVDTLRRSYSFGMILKIDDIAFSAPTEDGKQFATKYCQRQDYLVYT